MWTILMLMIASFCSGNIGCEDECKIDTCISRAAARFVWKLVSSGSNNGKLCQRDEFCIWILSKSICQDFKRMNEEAFQKSSKNIDCLNMTSKEQLLSRRNAMVKLSKLKNHVGVIVFLPYFGMAIVFLFILIWVHEEAEGLWTICKYRPKFNPSDGKKYSKKSQTMVRFDDCDACINTISSSVEVSKNKLIKSCHHDSEPTKNNKTKQLENRCSANLEQGPASRERNKEITNLSQLSRQMQDPKTTNLQIPKLILETKHVKAEHTHPSNELCLKNTEISFVASDNEDSGMLAITTEKLLPQNYGICQTFSFGDHSTSDSSEHSRSKNCVIDGKGMFPTLKSCRTVCLESERRLSEESSYATTDEEERLETGTEIRCPKNRKDRECQKNSQYGFGKLPPQSRELKNAILPAISTRIDYRLKKCEKNADCSGEICERRIADDHESSSIEELGKELFC